MTSRLAWIVLALCAVTLLAQDGPSRDGGGPRNRPPRFSPVFSALDLDSDGVISASELKNAPASLRKLDKNGDGQLTAEEVRPNFGPRVGPDGGPGGHGEEHDGPSNSAGNSESLVQP